MFQWYAWSAIDKNLKANAVSTKPRTTLTLASHPPLLGILLNNEGNIANNVNGNANAIENTNIVTIGVQNSPEIDWITTVPTIGPVQENDTRTNVNAIKKIPPSPFVSARLSVLVVREEGSVISNKPKNERANTMNTIKKMILGSQLVANQLKISTVTASPPKIRVIESKQR